MALSSTNNAVTGEPWEAYVEVQGQPPFSYQWYRGYRGDVSQPITNGLAPLYRTIPQGEQNTFWVRVMNKQGSADSAHIVVSVLPKLDYARELSELYRDARALLEQSDSMRVIDAQIHASFSGLAPAQNRRFNDLRKIAEQKQSAATTGFMRKLNYLYTLDRRVVSLKLQEAQEVRFPGIEGERRQKTLSTMIEHWDVLREGHTISGEEVIEDIQRYLPL